MGLYEQREEFEEDLKQIFQLVEGEIDECTVRPGALFFIYRQNTDFARPADLNYELADGMCGYDRIHLTAEEWAGSPLQFEVDYGGSEGIYLDLFYNSVGGNILHVVTLSSSWARTERRSSGLLITSGNSPIRLTGENPSTKRRKKKSPLKKNSSSMTRFGQGSLAAVYPRKETRKWQKRFSCTILTVFTAACRRRRVPRSHSRSG